MKALEKLVAYMLVYAIICVFALLQTFAVSDTQVSILTGPDYFPSGTGDTSAQQKSLNITVLAAQAEVRTVTIPLRGYSRGTLQIASGHPTAATFSTTGSMEAGVKVWAEAKPGSSGDLIAMASMPLRAVATNATGVTTPILVKGNYYFETFGNSFMILRVFGNATTDKTFTIALQR